LELKSSNFGGIEAGGSKFICVIASGPDNIQAETTIPTTTPDETIGQAEAFFQEYQEHEQISAVGIASFGPIDLDPNSQTFGYITTTPKKNWANTEFAGRIKQALGLPVAFDTDTNAAALAEATWGNARGLHSFVYLTVGTGIGGGGMMNGHLLHGLSHPEMGHLRLPHDLKQDPYTGACPFHGDCLEGLAAGPALIGRWGQPGKSLPLNHTAWPLEAHYLALGLANIIYTLSPQRIILSGGVMKQRILFPMIRREVQQILKGYLRLSAIIDKIDGYIVPPHLGDHAGVLGAIALAKKAIS